MYYHIDPMIQDINTTYQLDKVLSSITAIKQQGAFINNRLTSETWILNLEDVSIQYLQLSKTQAERKYHMIGLEEIQLCYPLDGFEKWMQVRWG